MVRGRCGGEWQKCPTSGFSLSECEDWQWTLERHPAAGRTAGSRTAGRRTLEQPWKPILNVVAQSSEYSRAA